MNVPESKLVLSESEIINLHEGTYSGSQITEEVSLRLTLHFSDPVSLLLRPARGRKILKFGDLFHDAYLARIAKRGELQTSGSCQMSLSPTPIITTKRNDVAAVTVTTAIVTIIINNNNIFIVCSGSPCLDEAKAATAHRHQTQQFQCQPPLRHLRIDHMYRGHY